MLALKRASIPRRLIMTLVVGNDRDEETIQHSQIPKKAATM